MLISCSLHQPGISRFHLGGRCLSHQLKGFPSRRKPRLHQLEWLESTANVSNRDGLVVVRSIEVVEVNWRCFKQISTIDIHWTFNVHFLLNHPLFYLDSRIPCFSAWCGRCRRRTFFRCLWLARGTSWVKMRWRASKSMPQSHIEWSQVVWTCLIYFDIWV